MDERGTLGKWCLPKDGDRQRRGGGFPDVLLLQDHHTTQEDALQAQSSFVFEQSFTHESNRQPARSNGRGWRAGKEVAHCSSPSSFWCTRCCGTTAARPWPPRRPSCGGFGVGACGGGWLFGGGQHWLGQDTRYCSSTSFGPLDHHHHHAPPPPHHGKTTTTSSATSFIARRKPNR